MNRYDIRLCNDRLPYLLKEKGFRYQGIFYQTDGPGKIVDFLNEKEDAAFRAEEHVYMLALVFSG